MTVPPPCARSTQKVRTRLLAAVVALTLAAMAIFIVGWIGMRSTQQALTGVEADLLPSITQALALAERTTQIAAAAPQVAESSTSDSLASRQLTVERLLLDVERLTAAQQGAHEARWRQLVAGVSQGIDSVAGLTAERHSVEARLRERLEQLGRVTADLWLHSPEATAPGPAFELWTTLFTGATTRSNARLGELEGDAEAFVRALRQHPAGFLQRDGRGARLVELAAGPDNVLRLRRRLLEIERQTHYLLSSTRTSADLLSEAVAGHVVALRAIAASRGHGVRAALAFGKTSMLLLACAAMLIVAATAGYVWRFIGQLESVTREMGRLAQGDTTQSLPAGDRPDELGDLARTFAVFRTALLDLKLERERLDAIHRSMTDALAVFDQDGALELWNPQLPQMLRCAPGRISARMTLRELAGVFPPGSTWRGPAHAQARPLDPLAMDDFAAFDRIEVRGPGEATYHVRSRNIAMGGTVYLITDVTAQRALELKARDTQRLELLGQLTGGVAHDFNNHLGTILGSLALLDEQAPLHGKDRVRLQRAIRATSRASALTRRLLAFARRQTLEAEAVIVDEMIEEMRDLIDYRAGDQVQTVLELKSHGAAVYVDRSQLENGILNLVINSAAAMPRGGTLRVHTRRIAQHGGLPGSPETVELVVADTGSGIPPELLPRVFEPFFSTKTPRDGSGLGLSIVYGFVRQSGGSIEIESDLGKGTRLVLQFPVICG